MDRYFEGATAEEVNSPQHYTQGDIECIDAIQAMLGQEGFVAYLRGTIVKYNWRLLHKGKALRDAQKLKWFSDRLEKQLAEDRLSVDSSVISGQGVDR